MVRTCPRSCPRGYSYSVCASIHMDHEVSREYVHGNVLTQVVHEINTVGVRDHFTLQYFSCYTNTLFFNISFRSIIISGGIA